MAVALDRLPIATDLMMGCQQVLYRTCMEAEIKDKLARWKQSIKVLQNSGCNGVNIGRELADYYMNFTGEVGYRIFRTIRRSIKNWLQTILFS